MEGIQTLKGSWPWPWPSIGPYGISSCISHRPLPIYQISFKLKKLFVDGRTYGRTDISPLYTIRSTLGSRPNNNVQISGKWSKSKLKVNFQYGGRLFFKNGSSYISANNWGMSTKFGLLIDFDLLKTVTSTNTKPELLSSGRGSHLENGYDVCIFSELNNYTGNLLTVVLAHYTHS